LRVENAVEDVHGVVGDGQVKAVLVGDIHVGEEGVEVGFAVENDRKLLLPKTEILSLFRHVGKPVVEVTRHCNVLALGLKLLDERCNIVDDGFGFGLEYLRTDVAGDDTDGQWRHVFVEADHANGSIAGGEPDAFIVEIALLRVSKGSTTRAGRRSHQEGIVRVAHVLDVFCLSYHDNVCIDELEGSADQVLLFETCDGEGIKKEEAKVELEHLFLGRDVVAAITMLDNIITLTIGWFFRFGDDVAVDSTLTMHSELLKDMKSQVCVVLSQKVIEDRLSCHGLPLQLVGAGRCRLAILTLHSKGESCFLIEVLGHLLCPIRLLRSLRNKTIPYSWSNTDCPEVVVYHFNISLEILAWEGSRNENELDQLVVVLIKELLLFIELPRKILEDAFLLVVWKRTSLLPLDFMGF
jgi:hypothetical protein